MKRIVIAISTLALCMGTMSACTSKEKKVETAKTTTETTEVVKTSSTPKSSEVILSGIIGKETVQNGENISLFLHEVQGEKDPENIAKGIGEEGVFLNVSEKQFEDGTKAESFSEGTKVEVGLDENPVMAKSMPPQIPSESIHWVKITPE